MVTPQGLLGASGASDHGDVSVRGNDADAPGPVGSPVGAVSCYLSDEAVWIC